MESRKKSNKKKHKKSKPSLCTKTESSVDKKDGLLSSINDIDDFSLETGTEGANPETKSKSKNDLKKVYAAVYGDDSSDADEDNIETGKKKIDSNEETKETEKKELDIISSDEDDSDEDDSDWTTDDEYFDCDSDDDDESSEGEEDGDTASINSTKDGMPCDITSKLKDISIDAKGKKTCSAQGKKPVLKTEECSYCKKTGEMKTCGRCHNAKYCDSECQKKHFKDHKTGCKDFGLERFKALIMGQCMYLISERGGVCGLRDVEEDEESLLDCTPLIVEIVGRIFHPFRIGIKVVDMYAETASLYFYNKEDTFTVWQKQGPVKVPKKYRRGQKFSMEECAQPGNFIVVYLPLWHYFGDGTKGLRMDEWNDFEFLFPFPK